MLKIDFWFDINENTKEVVDMILKNKEDLKKSDVQIRLRSLANEDSEKMHLLIHLARRNELKPIKTLQALLEGALIEELFTQEQIFEATNNNLYKNIIKNHHEHAVLNKVDNAPCLCFSHKLFLEYPFDEKEFLETVAEMIRRDKEIEYCYDDDDCLKQREY